MKPMVLRHNKWVIPSVMGILLIAGCGLIYWSGWNAPREQPARPISFSSSFKLTSNSGSQPWGKLTALRFPLCDEEVTAPIYERFSGAPRWFFAGVTERQLLRYFMSLSLNFRDRQMLLDRKTWRVTPAGIHVQPAESVVYALDAVSRERIYAVLGRDSANQLQHKPVVLARANLNAQLAAIGLTGTQIVRLKQLTYLNAGRLCLSDLDLARKVLGARAFENLVEFLFASPAYRLRLLVSAASDIDALAKYWGRGGREELIKPMLKSFARIPGGTDVAVSALLPDFARVRLFHYPDEKHDGPTVERQDCIYSALNFFNATPDARCLDDEHVREVLAKEYAPVTNGPEFGDLVLVRRSGGEVLHMCVYIADEFVFTKNGMGIEEPWTLMRADDVLDIYCPDRTGAQVNLLRQKRFNQPQSAPPPAPPLQSQTSPSQT